MYVYFTLVGKFQSPFVLFYPLLSLLFVSHLLHAFNFLQKLFPYASDFLTFLTLPCKLPLIPLLFSRHFTPFVSAKQLIFLYRVYYVFSMLVEPPTFFKVSVTSPNWLKHPLFVNGATFILRSISTETPDL